ncbi:phage tail tape measure protein [Priestia aryabhattai]|uniref:phage tail tape measure protein n=1 Tax=Priestia aryabhattai TaxID=412384 RepID=UPI003CA2F7F9
MANSVGSIRVSLGLDSIDFSKGLDNVNRKLKGLDSELKAAMAGAGRFDNSLDSLRSKTDILSRTLEAQNKKLAEQKRLYEESVRSTGKYSAESEKLLIQYNRTVSAIRKTEDQMNGLNKKIKDQGNGFSELSNKINTSIQSATMKLKVLDSAFDAATAGIKDFGSTTEQLRQKTDHLNQTINVQQQRLKDIRHLYLESKRAKGEDAQATQQLKIQLNEATASLKNTEAELRTINKQIDNNTGKWNVLANKLNGVEKSFQNAGGRIQAAGGEIATSFSVATAAVGGGLALSAKKAMDFEAQMSSVESVMDPVAANKFGKALEELAIKMGADTKYSSIEAAQGIEELVKAGVSVQDIIHGGLKGALSLATAGELELADAAEIASTALNAFKDDNLSVMDAADILSGAANASATSVGELKYSLAAVSSVASGVGLSFKDTSTALAVFAQNGLKGSDAGTSLKTMLGNLSPKTKEQWGMFQDLGLMAFDTAKGMEYLKENGITPVSDSMGDVQAAIQDYIMKQMGAKKWNSDTEKSFQQLGIASGFLNNAFYDTNGNIESMSTIAGALRKSLKGLSAEQRSQALYTLFGSDAIRAGNILFKEGAKGVNDMGAAMDKIKAADVAAKKLDNVKGAIEQLAGATETAQISLGNALVPAIGAVVAVLQHMVDGFNSLPGFIQSTIAITGALVTALLGLIATIGFLMLGVGQAMTGLGALAGVIGSVVKSAAIMSALGSVLAVVTNPIFLIVAAVGVLASAFIIAYKNSETFRDIVNGAFAAVKQAVLTAVTFIANITSTMWDKAVEGTARFRTAMSEAFSAFGQAFGNFVSYIGTASVDMWNKAVESTSAFRTAFIQKLGTFGPAFVEGFQVAVSSVGSFFIQLGSSIAGLFGDGLKSEVGTVIGGFIDQFKASFSSLGGIISLVAPTITALGLSFLGVSGPVGVAIGAIVSIISFLYRLSQTNADVRNALVSAWEGIKSVFGSAISALQPIFQVFQDSFTQMAQQLGPEFMKTGQVISQSMAQLKPALADLGAVFVELQGAFGSSISQLVQAFSGLIPVIVPAVASFVGAWANMQVSISQAVIPIVTTILPMLVNAITQIFPMILSVIQSVIPVVIGLINSLIPVILQIAQSILPMLLSVVQSVFPVVLSVIQSVIPIVVSIIQALVPVITTLVTSLIPMILSVVTAVFPVVLSIIKAVLPVVVTLIQTVISIIIVLVSSILPLILSVVKLVFPAVLGIIDGIIPLIVGLLKLVVGVITTVLVPAIQTILKIVQIIFPAVISVIQSAVTIITNTIKFFAAILKGDWSAAWTAVKNILSATWTAIISVIQAAVKVVIKALQGAWTIAENVTTSVFLAIYNFLKSIFTNIYNSIAGAVSRIWNNIASGWNTAKNKTTEIFTSIKNRITTTFNDIVNAAKSLPKRIGDGIKGMAGKAVDGVKALGSKMAKGLENVVNAITQDGVNKVLSKLGVDKKYNIPALDIPGYKTGTKGHPGGLAWLGDGRMHELFRTPDGTVGLSPNTDTLMNLPKGTEVLSGNQTLRALENLTPAYKNGTKPANPIKKAGKWIKDTAVDTYDGAKSAAGKAATSAKDFAFDVFEYASDPSKLMSKVFSGLNLKLPEINGSLGGIAVGALKNVKDGAVSYVKKKIEEFDLMFGESSSGIGGYYLGSPFRVTTPFMQADSLHPNKHKGLDLAAPANTPILSLTDGTVKQVLIGSATAGNGVRIQSGSDLLSYIHMISAPLVKMGQKVKEGQMIGRVGSTGFSTGNHLDLKIQRNGSYINPLTYLQGKFGGGGGYSGPVSGNLANWISQGMARAGVSGADWRSGLAWIINKESTGNPRAVGAPTSDGTAKGLMQLKHFNYKGDPFNPINNIFWGIKYILGRYKSIGGALSWWRSHNWYANGTKGHKGGSAVMGDAGKHEPFLLPNGSLGISPDTPSLFPNLPKGTIVWPSIGDFTKQLMVNQQQANWTPSSGSILGGSNTVSPTSIANSSTVANTYNSSSPTVNITVNYNGTGDKDDMYDLADVIKKEVKQELIDDMHDYSYKTGRKKR